MDFKLSDDQMIIQETVREFAQKEIAPVIRDYDARGAFPEEIIRKLGGLGFLGIVFPQEYGGAGLDYVTYCLIVEELAKADGSVALTVAAHNSLCTGHIYQAGNTVQKARYLPPLTRGERLGAWGLTEAGSGSDAAGMRTTATRDGEEFVLRGSKAFITNGSVAGTYVIMAVTDKTRGANGISAFIVERGTPGFRVGGTYDKLGVRASDTAELILEDACVPAGNLLGTLHGGFKDTLRVLDGGRIGVAAMAVGLAQGALDLALKYARERTAFGQPIAHFQGLQGMLADLAVEVEAARLLTWQAAYRLQKGETVTKESAMAKLFASEAAMKVTTKAIQIHGGMGYLKELPVERHFRDAKLCEIGEGTSEIQRLVIARQVLKGA